MNMETLNRENLIEINGGYADSWDWLGATAHRIVNAVEGFLDSVVEGASSGARKSPI